MSPSSRVGPGGRSAVASSSSVSNSVLSMNEARSRAFRSLSGFAGRVNAAPGTRFSVVGCASGLGGSVNGAPGGRLSPSGCASALEAARGTPRGLVARRACGATPIIVAARPETGGGGGVRAGGGC